MPFPSAGRKWAVEQVVVPQRLAKQARHPIRGPSAFAAPVRFRLARQLLPPQRDGRTRGSNSRRRQTGQLQHMVEFILEVIEGNGVGRQIPLKQAVDIGRERTLPLSLDDANVSRRHSRVTPSGSRAVVEDLGSTNGTYVNDQPIHGPHELKSGDRLRCGLTVLELRTVEQVATQPSTARPVPQVTRLDADVLQPVPDEDLSPVTPASPNVASFLVEKTEPAFVPRDVTDDPEAQSDYSVLARLVDQKVKRQTNIAGFAMLAIAGLAVLIFFGVR